MKTNYLFPHRFKLISGMLFIISFIMLVVLFSADQPAFQINAKVFAVASDEGPFGKAVHFGWIENPILDEVLMLIAITTGIVFAFSKEKEEDEMVASIRLHCLAWATIINYGLILLSYLLIYGFPFLNIMMAILFSQLLIFIVLFRYKIYKFNNTRTDEE
jgi:hypothetical protein